MKKEHKDKANQYLKRFDPDKRQSVEFDLYYGYHLRDEEVKELKDYNVELSNKAISLMAEVERLKELIEDAWNDGWKQEINGSPFSSFDDFKQQHGL